ncbi:MAG: hypothetical protein RL577_271 [Bacteroidota bacterium]
MPFSPKAFIVNSLLTFLGATVAQAQAQAPFGIRLEAHSPANFPAMQSFAWGQSGEDILFIAGRNDGLHKRQPFAAFDQAGIQGTWWVWNTQNDSLWSYIPSGFPAAIQEQLSASNPQFVQIEDTLLIAGGYAYSPTKAAHTTFANLSSIEVGAAIQAIKSGQSPLPYIQQIQDSRFQITGGHMLNHEGSLVLAGGHLFEGSYNPMGPDHGPGFTQQYTNSVYEFQVRVKPSLAVSNFQSHYDSLLFHKRDYNAHPIRMADGRIELGLFSGVFQYGVDLPWTNLVLWNSQSVTEVSDFEQLLNQYHTASVPLFSATQNKQYSLFFGGIGLYTSDASGNLIKDVNVPFVDHISIVERGDNDQFKEYLLDTHMPSLLGAAAEFIPASNLKLEHDAVMYDDLNSNQEVLLGYIVGGIESDAPNVFTSNTLQSRAKAAIYKVYITPSAAANMRCIESFNDMQLMAYTIEGGNQILLRFKQGESGKAQIRFFDETGRTLKWVQTQDQVPGTYEIKFDRSQIPATHGFVEVQIGQQGASRSLWLH